MCCSSWGRKESDMTDQLNWTDMILLMCLFKIQALVGLYACHPYPKFLTWPSSISNFKISSLLQMLPTTNNISIIMVLSLIVPPLNSVQFSCSVMSGSLWPHESQHARPPCPSPTHPLSSPSPPAPNPTKHQGLFQWVNSSHQVTKVLEFQPQHQSFQWTPRNGLL